MTDEDEIMGYAFFERVRGASKDRKARQWIKDTWGNSKPLYYYMIVKEEDYNIY